MSDTKELSVEHFRNIVESETKNLNLLCDKWSKVLLEQEQQQQHQQQKADDNQINNKNGNNNHLDHDADDRDDNYDDREEFQGAIRTTIGQAKLLMSQRFKQFSKLIDDCEFKRGPLPTRLEDLDGFWEMINYQVDDVRQKFKCLEEKY